MESLVAHFARTERERLRVVTVDVDEHDGLARRLRIEQIPTLVLFKGDEPVGRLDGRSTGTQIEELIEEHLSFPTQPEA
jgi:thioredoxin-like negative regulator of GroEL